MIRTRFAHVGAATLVALALLLIHGPLVESAGAQTGRQQARLLLELGRQKSAAGDRQPAIEAYTKAISMDSRFAEAYTLRGIEWMELSQLDQAVRDYSIAISLTSRDFVAYANRAWCYAQQGRLQEAFDDLNVADRLHPDHPKVAYQRGNLFFKNGDYDTARKYYERSMRLDPSYAATYSDLGSVHNRLGEFDRALAYFGRAIKIDPTHVSAWRNRAFTKRDMGRRAAAIEDFTEAIRLDPERAEFLLYRGKLRYDLGRYDEALADLRRHCELEPSGQDYTRLYVWLARAGNGDHEAATPELRAYLAERQKNPQAAADPWFPQIAGLLLGDVDEESALAVAAGAPDENVRRGRICEAHFYGGAAKLVGGDTAGATASFRRCIATNMREFLEYRSAKAHLTRITPASTDIATADER